MTRGRVQTSALGAGQVSDGEHEGGIVAGAPRYIDVTFDKPRKLRFDVNALDDLERLLGGVALGEIFGLLARGSVHALKLAVWQGLRHEDRNLTADKAGKLIQEYFDKGGRMADLSDQVVDAIYASGILRRPEEDAPADAENPPEATAAT